MADDETTTRSIVRDGIAVGIATGAYGISFGALSVSAGLSVWQSCALSLLVFTGASQFALVGVIASGGSPLFAAASGLLLGTRNTLYGLKVAPLVAWRGAKRAAAAHLVIDESSAMTITRTTQEQARAGFLSTGLSVFVLWNLATLAGAIAGDSLGDPRSYGLDAAVGGAFVPGPAVAAAGHDAQPGGRAARRGRGPLAGFVHSGGCSRARGLRRGAGDGPDQEGRRGMIWLAILGCGVGCYLLKLAGMSVPEKALAHPVVRRTADLLPVVLLAALVAVQVFVSKGPDGPQLSIDARLAGLGAAFVALLLRMPFLVVVFVAALTAALIRL
jgi:predicted branched-subunit amino acid permease/branched-subunit amino acid transport protein